MTALDTSLLAAETALLQERFPARQVALPGAAQVQVRSCGQGPALVCLHGIGSGAASWLRLAQCIAPQAQLIAWDAPGYGRSSPLAQPAPLATDYAQRLLQLLDALQIERCVLLGHSLGALVAAAAAQPGSALASRITSLILLSPARGYGAAELQEKSASVRHGRLQTLEQLGIAGMAEQRSANLLSEHASALQRAWVRSIMGQLQPQGYRQAIELLCGDDLLAYTPPAMPVRVLCGALDTVTPPSACAAVASACAQPLELIANAGHACYVEQPQAVFEAIRSALCVPDTSSF